MARRRRIGEFDLIARYFAPLARSFAGAGGLMSDNAFLPADPRHDLVVKTDTIVSGVHFLADERPDLVGAKALLVCLSDLAAGGATPFVYQLALSLGRGWREQWVAGFARGLTKVQREHGIVLCGGDTTGTPGPTTITVAAFGRVASGKGLRRDGARAGDELWVTGTVGDGALGLLAAKGRVDAPGLERRYRQPRPPTALGPRLVGVAGATADISDGLLADAGHIADASCLAVSIERDHIPLSAAARRLVTSDPSLWANVVGGGDDYQLLIALPPRRRTALLASARSAGVKVTLIGGFGAGDGVDLTVKGRPIRSPRKGYVHF